MGSKMSTGTFDIGLNCQNMVPDIDTTHSCLLNIGAMVPAEYGVLAVGEGAGSAIL
jgi:hypothetical protein